MVRVGVPHARATVYYGGVRFGVGLVAWAVGGLKGASEIGGDGRGKRWCSPPARSPDTCTERPWVDGPAAVVAAAAAATLSACARAAGRPRCCGARSSEGVPTGRAGRCLLPGRAPDRRAPCVTRAAATSATPWVLPARGNRCHFPPRAAPFPPRPLGFSMPLVPLSRPPTEVPPCPAAAAAVVAIRGGALLTVHPPPPSLAAASTGEAVRPAPFVRVLAATGCRPPALLPSPSAARAAAIVAPFPPPPRSSRGGRRRGPCPPPLGDSRRAVVSLRRRRGWRCGGRGWVAWRFGGGGGRARAAAAGPSCRPHGVGRCARWGCAFWVLRDGWCVPPAVGTAARSGGDSGIGRVGLSCRSGWGWRWASQGGRPRWAPPPVRATSCSGRRAAVPRPRRRRRARPPAMCAL